jgi:hypothetical protein
MAFRPWRWLVFFFTRPIRLSDLSALAARLKPRPKPVSTPLPLPAEIAAVAAAPIEVPRSRPSPSRERPKPRTDAGPSAVSSIFHPQLEVGVSEQPLDTLPSDLRDELQRPSTGRLQGSLRDG